MFRPRSMTCLWKPLLVALAVGLGAVGIPAPAGGQDGGASGLEDLFDAGLIFQDRNGDEVVDFVDVGIVLGLERSDSDLAAALDVAARLGFETMAMDIPVRRDAPQGSVGIVVGRGGAERLGLDVGELDALAAGTGMVTRASSAAHEWLVIAGADDAGTRAAAAAFGGRLPYVGSASGATLADLTADIEEYLAGEGISVQAVSVPTIHAQADGDGSFSSVDVLVSLSAADVSRAQAALEEVPARRQTGPSDDADTDRSELLSYSGAGRLSVSLTGSGGTSVGVEIRRAEPEAPSRPTPARPGSGGKDDLDLSTLFEAEGLLGDSDNNVIPDRIDAVLSASGPGVDGAIDLAARLGLESAGITLPLGRTPDEISDAENEPTLVAIGVDHPLVADLVDDGKLAPGRIEALAAGEGLIEVVPDAFGDKRAVVVTGGDANGVARALEQLSEQFPNLSERGHDRATIDQVESEIWSFLSQRSPGGQAAAALYKLDRMVDELSGRQIDAAQVTVSLEKIEPGLEALVRERVASLGVTDLSVRLDDRDVQRAAVLSEEAFDIPSEVDAFWDLFRERVIPGVRRGAAVHVEARLSEPPEVRQRIAEQARELLIEAGADTGATQVVVLSAFKQGFSWLREVIVPELRKIQSASAAPTIGGIRVNFAETGPPEDWPQQAMYSKVRWLKEIWPVDEVMSNDLSLDPELVDFQMAPIDAPTYEVVVTSTSGSELLRRTFEPKYVLQPYYERFDDYELVRVSTGWLAAHSGDDTLIDERIVTDIESFWEHYQSKTLSGLYDHVMEVHDGNPRSADAPYFGELTVEVSLSEPDYLLGIDKEYISSLDSLHEEIYFPTLFFFRVLGRMARGEELSHIGRVIPIMRPNSSGEGGWAKIRLTGFATSRPAVVVDYTEADGTTGQVRRDIPVVTVERPSALAATVRAGQEGLDSLDIRVKVDFEADDRADLLQQADEFQVDSRIMTAVQATSMIDNLVQLRARGLYEDALAFHGLGTIRIAAGWDWKIDREAQAVATLGANGNAEPYPSVADLLPAGGYRYAGENLVQWETPIPPPEGHAILARMSTFPEATMYHAGRSYLGKDIWAMVLMPPIDASHWSRYKFTTQKPTVVYSARQHANEVSSTSHVLKLAELLLTDEEFQKKLLDVNVIIHPFTNPDGAQLAYDLYEITPDFILHAGYLGSLGQDATNGGREDMPIYPESKVRPTLWRTWLPDIFLNPHGYPSHEVVQLFSEYAGLVRRGRITERNWSVNRGWFLPGFGYLDDPQFPRHKNAAFKIRDYITRYINDAEDVRAMNGRAYDRYQRYGGEYEPFVYRQDMVNGVNIQMPLKGGRSGQGGPPGDGYNPRVTIWSGNTEAPDETAYGDWMELVATAGLQWDKAILDYLYEGEHSVDRKGAAHWGGGVRLWLDRPRPPKPDEDDAE
ncbi:MAG TPA: M14 family metallopeptidase [Acidobacteriota bacterium]|nr:M14 family metallopeptidase [Acidobacteriota bacterium]